MRVVHIGMGLFSDQRGGLNRYAYELARQQNADGHDVRLVVFSNTDTHDTWIERIGTRNDALPVRLAKVFGAVWTLRRWRPDVVDVHFALYGLPALLALVGMKCRIVIHFHGPWADEVAVADRTKSHWSAIRRAVENFVYRRADSIVVLSDQFGELMTSRYDIKPGLIQKVPPGVRVQADQVRSRNHDAQGPLRILTVRRLSARMGLDILLQAAAQLTNRQVNFHLDIVGSGEARDSLAQLSDDLDISESVTFLGSVGDSDLTTLYQHADIFVMPSLMLEGFGLVVLESLARGVPVITTRYVGAAEIVDGLSPHLLCDPGDVEQLADRLVQVANGNIPSAQTCVRHASAFTWQYAAALVERRAYT